MEIPCDKEKILKFERENSEFLSNNLVASFLNIQTNKEIYLETICNPTPENMKKIDNLFKNFYFKIRFISHISTTLKFNSINYDKKSRLIQSRYTPTLDASINSNEGSKETFLDLIADENAENLIDVFNKNLNEHITCPILYDAFDNLTYKQKQIINLAYVDGLSDTEIALVLNVTQQAVSKMHKKALKNMHKYIDRQSKEIGSSEKRG